MAKPLMIYVCKWPTLLPIRVIFLPLPPYIYYNGSFFQIWSKKRGVPAIIIIKRFLKALNGELRSKIYSNTTQPPTVVCKMEAQLDYVRIACNFFSCLTPICMLLLIFINKISVSLVGCFLRLRCWLGKYSKSLSLSSAPWRCVHLMVSSSMPTEIQMDPRSERGGGGETGVQEGVFDSALCQCGKGNVGAFFFCHVDHYHHGLWPEKKWKYSQTRISGEQTGYSHSSRVHTCPNKLTGCCSKEPLNLAITQPSWLT